jgi:signal peptidase
VRVAEPARLTLAAIESEQDMPSSSRIERVVYATMRVTARLALLALALLVALCLTVVIVLPRATHGVALTVLTGSMTPEIPVGSVVVVRPVDPRTLLPGDIATYQVAEDRKAFITHRVVKVHDDPEGLFFTFKGDANRGTDVKPIPAGAVRGEVWFHVPYLGGIRDALHGKGGVTLFGMLLLAGYAISQVSAGLRERRSTRAASAPAAVVLDAPVLYAEFGPDAVGDLRPDAVVQATSGFLVASDDQHFAVICRPLPDGVLAAAELLRQHNPRRLLVLEGATLDGSFQPVELAAPLTSEERSHARADS